MDHAIRTYILNYRDQLRIQADTILARVSVIDAMVADMEKEMEVARLLVPPEFTTGVKSNGMYVTEGLPPRKERNDAGRKRGTYKPRSYDTPTADIVRSALAAAGEEGLTARELAELADIPKGTASARLTVMKQQGQVMHIAPKYFAIHSEPQDNNQ